MTAPTAAVTITAISMPIADACAALGIGRSRMYELLGQGLFDARKDGSRTVITGESMRAYVASLPKAKIKASQKKTTKTRPPHWRAAKGARR